MRHIHIKCTNESWQNFEYDSSNRGIYYRGTCYRSDNLVTKTNLEKKLHDVSDRGTFENFVNELNGFYALIHRVGNTIYAAVDRIRSIPLFYGIKDHRFFLSDDAEWVRQQVGDTQMDPIAKEEFQLVGYVTGQETLFPNVKQLQAGEFLVAREIKQEVAVNCCRYYRFLHTELESFNEIILKQKLDKETICAI